MYYEDQGWHKMLTFEEILSCAIDVCSDYGISVTKDMILSKSRSSIVTYPRHIIAYLCMELLGMGPSQTGKALNRDHATVIHSRKLVGQMAPVDSVYGSMLTRVCNKLGVEPPVNTIAQPNLFGKISISKLSSGADSKHPVHLEGGCRCEGRMKVLGYDDFVSLLSHHPEECCHYCLRSIQGIAEQKDNDCISPVRWTNEERKDLEKWRTGYKYDKGDLSKSKNIDPIKMGVKHKSLLGKKYRKEYSKRYVRHHREGAGCRHDDGSRSLPHEEFCKLQLENEESTCKLCRVENPKNHMK
jgi:hypothetical protein